MGFILSVPASPPIAEVSHYLRLCHLGYATASAFRQVLGSLEKKIRLQSALRALSPCPVRGRLVFLRYRPLRFFLFLLRNGRPEAGGSTCAGLAADGECAE